jgi:hypothetical protein
MFASSALAAFAALSRTFVDGPKAISSYAGEHINHPYEKSEAQYFRHDVAQKQLLKRLRRKLDLPSCLRKRLASEWKSPSLT